MRMLDLGELKLPVDAQTQTLVVYGAKGMGKTNFGSVFVEELAAKRLKFNVIDPIDVWWGVQHGAGLDVVILGGTRGDIPIEPTAGPVVADFVVDESVSTVTVLRHASGKMWSKAEKIRFITEYCVRLYERQGEERRPVMQIIDEAGRYVPQNPGKGDIDIAKCIGAIEEMVECGRNVGIGVCLITQRSARMNKSVSELAELMVAFRTVGPNSVQAIVDWFGEHVERERHKELVAELRKLERGTALVVSPGWLQFEGVCKIRARRTFDSSATPAPGKSLRAPGPARKPDLEQYCERMAATVEKASQENPKELRKQIAQLKTELQKRPAAKSETVEVPVLTDQDRFFLADFVSRMVAVHEAAKTISSVGDHFASAASRLGSAADRLLNHRATAPAPTRVAHPPIRKKQETRDPPANGHVKLGRGERATMAAVAQFPDGVSKDQLRVLTGYKRSSRDAYLHRLRAVGYIEEHGDRVLQTEAGIDWLGDDYRPLPTGDELRQHWLQKLPEGERVVLEMALKLYPSPLANESIDDATGYAVSSRNAYILRLAKKMLVRRGRGEITASEVLFS